MTIKPGQAWGTEVPRPETLAIAHDDAGCISLLSDPSRSVGLDGGDLFRSLGSPGWRDPVQRLPVDVIEVEVDGRFHRALAHVVLRRGWWRGKIIAVMNVDHIGGWNVAPRAHPNDGVLDIVEVAATMSVRQRWVARGRLEQGTHLPHPDISTRRAATATWRFDRPTGVWIDGRSVGTGSIVSVAAQPDAGTVYV